MQKQKKSNKVSINYNTKIYPTKFIKKAIKDFEGFGAFDIKKAGKDRVEVSVSNFEPSSKEILINEFSNYILGLIQQ